MVNQHNQQQTNQIVSNAQMNTVPLSIDVVGQPFANSNQLLVTGLPHIQNVNSIGSLPYMDQSQARQLIPMMSEVERPKRTRTHVCNYENCNKSFDTKWGLARYTDGTLDPLLLLDIFDLILERNPTFVIFLVVERDSPRSAP